MENIALGFQLCKRFIVYPDLGHSFAPSNQWIDSHGQMEEYVFQDMFEWLTSPAREVNEKIVG
jgi:uncharacterized protein